ncbi:hypothetical protein BD770DRAFT_450233 [Pilaira anomala]|nr:hypothetical protein BD770DRAFT_450233 [Pilaira anomala]
MSGDTTLGISLFNAQGISDESIDSIINNLHICTNLFFITETWLYPPNRTKIHSQHWKQHHNYGRRVEGSHNREEAIQPYTNNNDIENIILCGDFNSRLGNYTGDHNTNSRCNVFLNFISEYGLTLQNIELAYGIPTLLTGSSTTSTVKSSIIDFFLTNNDEVIIAPVMKIESELSLGSDHKLLYFGFTHNFAPPPTVHLHPRILWKINKFKPKPDKSHIKYIEKYRTIITPQLKKYTEKLKTDIFTELTHDHRQQQLDNLNSELIEIIQKTLEEAVGKKTQKNKSWKWFWTQELEDATNLREHLYRKWYRAHTFNKCIYWKKFIEAADKVRNMIQIAKNKCFRQFCEKLRTNEFNINGPQATVDKITDTWKNIYNDPQDLAKKYHLKLVM